MEMSKSFLKFELRHDFFAVSHSPQPNVSIHSFVCADFVVYKLEAQQSLNKEKAS